MSFGPDSRSVCNWNWTVVLCHSADAFMHAADEADLATCLNYKKLFLTQSVTRPVPKLLTTMEQALRYNEWRRDDRSCTRVAYLLLPQPLLVVTVAMLGPCPL